MQRLLTLAHLLLWATLVQAGPRQAGVATTIITPPQPMWMAGYASRTKPAEGTLHELHAKALCLEDETGTAVILLTSDLIGLPKSMADKVAVAVSEQTGLPRERFMLTASHTHCGPVLRDNLMDMYDMSPGERDKVMSYAPWLTAKLAEVMVQSFKSRQPARWKHGTGECGFAMNRRQALASGVVIGLNPDAPVDHRVPVLLIEAVSTGKPIAVAFGYACHNTTLDNMKWSGDYAGFARIALEKELGIPALFWTGCGADANPNPRRTVEIAETHGKSLAASVINVIKSPMTTVEGAITAQFDFVELDFEKLPTETQLKADLTGKTFAVRTRAARLLKQIEREGALSQHYTQYPVQTWSFGRDITWVALGGEVVVDYALRIRSELKQHGTVWVAGYANDVMSYIPSERILNEGGYEADSSMIYYGMPGRWDRSIEERIMTAVRDQNRKKGPMTK